MSQDMGDFAWKRRKSIEIDDLDMPSRRGTLRAKLDELPALGFPESTQFAVPANRFVVADACGFHARAAGSFDAAEADSEAAVLRSTTLAHQAPGSFQE